MNLPNLSGLTTNPTTIPPLATLNVYNATAFTFLVEFPSTTNKEGVAFMTSVAKYLLLSDDPIWAKEDSSIWYFEPDGTQVRIPLTGDFANGKLREREGNMFFYVTIARPWAISDKYKSGKLLMEALYVAFPTIADNVETAVAYAVSKAFYSNGMIETRGAFSYLQRPGEVDMPRDFVHDGKKSTVAFYKV